MLVTFSWLRDSEQRPWLLAEIEECPSRDARLNRLTAAESQVLRLLAHGLSNSEMAERLGVSGETVKTHVKRVLSKLNVNSRAKAALAALRYVLD